jgi:hypothetical protein
VLEAAEEMDLVLPAGELGIVGQAVAREAGVRRQTVVPQVVIRRTSKFAVEI